MTKTGKRQAPKSYKSLKQLGSKETHYNFDYDPKLLEKIPFSSSSQQWVSLLATEFTSLCPKTNQPDFARIYVNYIPNAHLVESKSFKMYLFSFRNHGGFHEECVRMIGEDLNKLLKPFYLEVMGEFTPRGGISIYPFAQYADQKKSDALALLKERQLNYAPGRYTMPMQRLY